MEAKPAPVVLKLRGNWLGLLPSFSLLPVLAEQPAKRTWYSECMAKA